ncbi:hypothetical protein [Roseivirga pacifica]|uniref:hypothetical protein n=1 Tax=Roseivirga pacifica TaxID=1267423 RepID=UPI003BACC253
MKIKNILIALSLTLFVACSGKKSEEDHAHGSDSHEHPEAAADDHGHSHDANGGHSHEEGDHDGQEEFTVGSDGMMKTDTTLTLAANKAMEFKFHIEKGKSLSYTWKSTGSLVYDFHGDPDPELGYEKGYFESYGKGNSTGETGEHAMPYNGSHGWYWKNTSANDVTITLSTSGEYTVIGLKQ